MSEPRVTITLGRSGQKVVKRPQMESGGSGMEAMRLSGGKQPTDQRIRNGTDGILFPPSKRFRGEFGTFNPGYSTARGVARNDLRLKLVRKELLKRVHSEVEERKKRKLYGNVSGNTESAERRILRHASPINIAGEMMRPESHRKSYPHVADAFNPSSQNGVVKFSQEISLPRHIDGLQQLSSGRASNASRTGQVLQYVLDHSRTLGPAPVQMRATSGPGRLVMEPSSASGVANTSYSAEQTLTVSGLLHSLGLGKYAVTFQAEEVDMAALKQMGDKDLKELGIPMGPRKKILLALLPRHGRQPL